MALANKTWTPVSVHLVVSEFLISERGRIQTSDPKYISALDSPDLTDPEQNQLRLHLLYFARRWILGEIPLDTEWFEVRHLTGDDLDELRVIARWGWDDPSHRNELRTIAANSPDILRGHPEQWRRPILWGHSKAGPFTIVEGNHRLIACAAASPTPNFAIPVFVGLSPTCSHFHIEDPEGIIALDFWK